MAFRKSIKLIGYILPEKGDEVAVTADGGSDNEEEVEEQQPEFLDTSEMASVSSGGFVIQQNLPALSEVDVMFRKQKRRVRGRFVLKNPWWEIFCTAKEFNHKLEVDTYQKMVSYKLRTDLTKEGHSLLPLFLKECGVNAEFVKDFMQWLPKDRSVLLVNVQEALSDFGENNGNMREVADYARSAVSKSDAGFYVRAATMYPYVMEYLPRLLPGQFLNLLRKGKEEEKGEKSEETEVDTQFAPQEHGSRSVLASLEELLKTDAWKLGFNYIMLSEFKLVRCEATLVAFKDCGLYSKIPPEKQEALQVYDELKSYCRKLGHTYIELKLLEKRVRCKNGIWNAVDFLCQCGVLIKDKQKIALRNLYQYERGIAQCLQQLMTEDSWKIDLDVSEVLRSAERERLKAKADADSSPSSSEKNGMEDEASGSTSDVNEPMDEEPETTAIELDPDQVRAAEMMCANAVTIVSGKGGCGKTTVVSLVFKAAMKNISQELNCSMLEEGEEKTDKKPPIKVLLTAPTGRAAALLTKRTDSKAYTMHQVWWSYKNTEKSNGGQPKDWMFAHVQVLVVDEGSLVPVQILHSILSILTKYAQLQKIVILGDIRQLPSIEPGNVLSDLFTSLKKAKWAIEMRKNHRSESSRIVDNAGLIADIGQRKMPYQLNFDATVDLSKPFTLPSSNNSFIHILPNDDDLQDAIKQLLKGPAPGLEDDKSSQFVAFRRADCDLINELCCKHYSHHTTKDHKNKKLFQKGDKVCCTRNGYVSYVDTMDKANDKEKVVEKIKKEEQQKKERLCNGEIFFITEDVTEEDVGLRHKRRFLILDDKEGRVLKVDYSELMRECKLRHAWARTIHTFQGSEAKTVVYVLSSKYCKYETWKHVYTAVTRGQSRVYIIANKKNLEQAVREQDIPRNTRLAGFVKELVHDLGVASEDWQSQSQFNTPRREPNFQKFHMQSSPSPGPSQAYPRMPSQCANENKDAALQNLTNADGGLGSPITPSGSPGVFMQQGNTANSPTPSKQLKMEHMSLLSPRNLFK